MKHPPNSKESNVRGSRDLKAVKENEVIPEDSHQGTRYPTRDRVRKEINNQQK